MDEQGVSEEVMAPVFVDLREWRRVIGRVGRKSRHAADQVLCTQ
jgi:hypothetical protein